MTRQPTSPTLSTRLYESRITGTIVTAVFINPKIIGPHKKSNITDVHLSLFFFSVSSSHLSLSFSSHLCLCLSFFVSLLSLLGAQCVVCCCVLCVLLWGCVCCCGGGCACCCGCGCVHVCAFLLVLHWKNAPVCTFKTLPCARSKRQCPVCVRVTCAHMKRRCATSIIGKFCSSFHLKMLPTSESTVRTFCSFRFELRTTRREACCATVDPTPSRNPTGELAGGVANDVAHNHEHLHAYLNTA